MESHVILLFKAATLPHDNKAREKDLHVESYMTL
jgi:hypothetical protein